VKVWPASGKLHGEYAGWKTKDYQLNQHQQSIKSVLSWLDAVPEETSFTTTLRIHNLREVELGALLWALTFREDAAPTLDKEMRRHRLGGSKPYGLGEVEIRIGEMNIERNDGQAIKSEVNIISAFRKYMNCIPEVTKQQNWSGSAQAKTLLKAAQVQDYVGHDSLDYIRGSYLHNMDKTPQRHSELRNGGGQQPGGHFLPAYTDGWEAERSLPAPVAGANAGAGFGRPPNVAPIMGLIDVAPADLTPDMMVFCGPRSGNIIRIKEKTVVVRGVNGEQDVFAKIGLKIRAP
jgi:hypothetical protein